MDTPLVTIVIATYCTDREQFAAALDSARDQSHSKLEILIGDDSPDDSLRPLVVQRNDDRLVYVHNVLARGVAVNHWCAFNRAHGEFIVVLNHDDWLAPHFVATMVSALQQNPQAVLAFCDHWLIDNGGRKQVDDTERTTLAWGRAGLAPGMHRPFENLLLAQTIPMAMGTMFRRSALPAELPANAGPAYDLWLTYLLARTGDGAFYVPERLSAWRDHAGNQTTAAALPWLQGAADCWQAVAADPLLMGVRRAARARAAGGYCACAIRCWRNRKPMACAKFAMRSVRTRVTLRGLGLLMLSLLPQRLGASLLARRAA